MASDMESIVTEYTQNCIICGIATTEEHHFVFDRGNQMKANTDKIVAPMCRFCHDELHNKSCVAAELSRICGQLAWEKHEIATTGCTEREAREKFRLRYGKNYC